jgi:hypothetical protein
VAIKANRKSSLFFLVADLLTVAVIFNLASYLRGVGGMPVLWPLLAPALVFVGSLHLIDGYGSRTDLLSLDYASLHLIASFSAAIVTLLLAFAFIPAGFGWSYHPRLPAYLLREVGGCAE